jgi:hypothetical protein
VIRPLPSEGVPYPNENVSPGEEVEQLPIPPKVLPILAIDSAWFNITEMLERQPLAFGPGKKLAAKTGILRTRSRPLRL